MFQDGCYSRIEDYSTNISINLLCYKKIFEIRRIEKVKIVRFSFWQSSLDICFKSNFFESEVLHEKAIVLIYLSKSKIAS